ncbi:MAG: hypothetical protein QF619_12360, partial [Candidatus Binatia bacterium]|nr:hypothetical protein [Candidatus Binatia bacterium]
TSLIPHGTLYLRYDSEDLGEILPESCACGSTWPLMKVYDRSVNLVKVAGKEILPYDVRLCLDEVPELAGIPFAVVRAERGADVLRLVLQKPNHGDIRHLEDRLAAVTRERLRMDVKEEWTEELPERWKGVTVIEEKDWGAPRV